MDARWGDWLPMDAARGELLLDTCTTEWHLLDTSVGERLLLDALGDDSVPLHAPWGDRLLLADLSDDDHHLRHL